MTRDRLRSALFLVFAALAVWLAQAFRGRLGIDFSVESLRSWVIALGWTAPVSYVVLLAFRPFLLLPSVFVLPVGGACFGLVAGTVLGGAGVTAAALIQFWIARGIGHEGVRRRVADLLGSAKLRVESAGPLLVGLVTAHPTGPMTASHWGAAFASVPLPPFVVAVLAGALARAFLYSFFGASLADPGSSRLILATVLLVIVFVAPLAHPELRRRVFVRTPS